MVAQKDMPKHNNSTKEDTTCLSGLASMREEPISCILDRKEERSQKWLSPQPSSFLSP